MCKNVIDEQLARIEELERTVQYLIDCPFTLEDSVKRKQFANDILDRKPSESLAAANKKGIGQ
ncbi:hypothetical protein VPHK250G1_0071 [Vibrio phage K250 g1]|nr:hypothetical protein NVP1205O_59 [Vibrio phage 1.205.O._10N.222.51.A7]